MKFRKIGSVVEAVQFTGSNWNQIAKLSGSSWYRRDESLILRTPEGWVRVDPSDWVVKDVNGDLSSCNPEVFEATYERAR